MTKKVLVARLGVGTLTVAFCAVLPGCNLGVVPVEPCLYTAMGCTDASPSDTKLDTEAVTSDGRPETDAP